MVGTLTGSGVTVFMMAEVSESFTDLRVSPDLISCLCDDVIFERYVEMEGRMRKVMTPSECVAVITARICACVTSRRTGW
jgi:circadian clock protein KaiC